MVASPASPLPYLAPPGGPALRLPGTPHPAAAPRHAHRVALGRAQRHADAVAGGAARRDAGDDAGTAAGLRTAAGGVEIIDTSTFQGVINSTSPHGIANGSPARTPLARCRYVSMCLFGLVVGGGGKGVGRIEILRLI